MPDDHPSETPYWSQDGKWIYYSAPFADGWEIWKAPAEGGSGVPVTRRGGRLPVDAPDSKTLYYLKTGPGGGAGRLFRSAPDGSGETELLAGVDYFSFAVTRDRIFYLHERPENRIEIRQFLLGSGVDSLVSSMGISTSPGLSVSPDGRSLIFSEFQPRGNVMIADTLE